MVSDGSIELLRDALLKERTEDRRSYLYKEEKIKVRDNMS